MNNQQATSYDYKTVRVKRETEVMLCDAYSTLGWEVVNTTIADAALTHVNVSFKRDRKTPNKTELMRLQSKIDGAIANIEKLQSSQRNAGIPEAITIGTIGTLTLGGGMSMIMVIGGLIYTAAGIAVGVAGIGIGLLGFAVYKNIHRKKGDKLEPLLESEYTKLSDLCDEAAQKLK